MLLAIEIVRTNLNLQTTKIARIYKVLYKTLCRRIQRMLARSDISLNSRKLTKLEEKVIIRYILDLDSRAFPPRRSDVEDIANRLLAERDGRRVRKN